MMEVKTEFDKEGFKINLVLDFEEANDFVRDQLLLMRQDIEYLCDTSLVDTWDALNQIIAYISSKDQILNLPEVSPDWVIAVANK